MFSSSGFVLAAGSGSIPPLWPILLVAVLGCASIYLLLPRPRPYPTLWGVSLGTLALIATGILIVNNGSLSIESLLFYAFAAIAVASGTLLVTQHIPARAALSFVLVVLSTCGLFLLLAAPFLMAATIIIYAGAIVVTFLFVLMLAQQSGLSSADDRSREPLFSAIAGFAFLGAILFLLEAQYGTSALEQTLRQIRHAREQENAAAIAKVMGDEEQVFKRYLDFLDKHHLKDLWKEVFKLRNKWPVKVDGAKEEELKEILDQLLAIGLQASAQLGLNSDDENAPHGDHPEKMSSLSGPSAITPSKELRRDPATGVPQLPAENATYLGRSLFTDYLLPVELGGFLLLVAVVGAIAIAQRGGSQEMPS
jgi:NADH-quinone oxidoreductase subunit J